MLYEEGLTFDEALTRYVGEFGLGQKRTVFLASLLWLVRPNGFSAAWTFDWEGLASVPAAAPSAHSVHTVRNVKPTQPV